MVPSHNLHFLKYHRFHKAVGKLPCDSTWNSSMCIKTRQTVWKTTPKKLNKKSTSITAASEHAKRYHRNQISSSLRIVKLSPGSFHVWGCDFFVQKTIPWINEMHQKIWNFRVTETGMARLQWCSGANVSFLAAHRTSQVGRSYQTVFVTTTAASSVNNWIFFTRVRLNWSQNFVCNLFS